MAAAAPWTDLPPEVLDKIFQYIPRFSRYPVGQVCRYWRQVLHQQAVNYLLVNIKKQLIDENQLARFGWSPAEDHDIATCSCIHIVFRLLVFAENTATKFKQMDFGGRGFVHTPCATTATKLFFGTTAEKQTRIHVVDRLRLNTTGRILKKPGAEVAEHEAVRLYCCGDLLVILQRRITTYDCIRLRDFTISLWSASSEAWFGELDFLCRIPADLLNKYHERMDRHDGHTVEISDIAISKNMLAVHIFNSNYDGASLLAMHVNVTLFWRIYTSQTELQFLTAVRHARTEDCWDDDGWIFMNETFFACYRYRPGDSDLEVFNIASGQLAPESRLVILNKEDWWGDCGNTLSLKLEPGESGRLAVHYKETGLFKIVDLATGHVVAQIQLINRSRDMDWFMDTLYDANWLDGYFFFLHNTVHTPRSIQNSREGVIHSYQVVIFDPDNPGPRHCGETEDLNSQLLSGLTIGPTRHDRSYYVSPEHHIIIDYSGIIIVDEQEGEWILQATIS